MESEMPVVLPPPGTMMQCPYCPRHTILSEHYFHHLNVCNKKPAPARYDFLKAFEEPAIVPKPSFLDVEVAREIAGKLQNFVEAHYAKFALFEAEPSIKEASVRVPFLQSQKHAPQLSSLIAHLLPLTHDAQTIIEAGAGTGMLSAYLAWSASDSRPERQFYLIERDQGFKHKFDRYARREGESVERLVCDLREIDFGKLLAQMKYQSVLVMGKHLCGHATDCVLNWKAHDYAIALCCHSKADGSQLVGREYLRSMLSEEEIAVMFRMTSWYFAWLNSTLNGLSDEQIEQRAAKIRLGRLFRYVIDVCRILWLEQQGYSVELATYCDEKDSPECYLLMASRSVRFPQ